MTDLFPCPACSRHVAGDAPCPFCGAAQPVRAPRAAFAGPFVRVAIFGAAALGAPACWTTNPPMPKQTATAAGEASVEGVLTSGSTGLPLPNHRISLEATGQERRFATTDAEGHYRFAKLPAGNYVITFAPPRNPRGSANMTTLQIAAGATQRVDWTVADREPSAIPMPYGAPPARRRLV